MPLPEIPGCIRANVRGTTVGGDKWNNVFHIGGNGTFGQNYADLVGEAIRDAYLLLATYIGPATRFEEVVFQDLSDTPGLQFWYTPSDTDYGASTDDNMPPQLAQLVSWRTATGGRAGRGRTFLAGIAENANTLEGGPLNTWLDLVDDWQAAMLAAPAAGEADNELVIISYYEGYTWSAGPPYKKIPTVRATPVVSPIVSGAAGTRFATMRSRNNSR